MSLFAELGLRRYLNAEDTFTTNGASCMPPEVYRAMEHKVAHRRCAGGKGAFQFRQGQGYPGLPRPAQPRPAGGQAKGVGIALGR